MKRREKNPGAELLVMGANPAKRVAGRVRQLFGRNPSSDAQRLNEDFHARPTRRVYTARYEGIPTGEYAQLGVLYSIAFRPVWKSYCEAVFFKQRDVKVLASQDGRQIYFAFGNQSLDESLAKENVRVTGAENLGEVRSFEYITRKFHSELNESVRGKEVYYTHKFGEESGRCPQLWYDASLKHIEFRGGDYVVEWRGVVN